jgi:chorismate mutase
MKNKKITTIRKKLDILDGQILNLIKKRTFLVDDVLKTKTFKKQIIDKKRISVILKKIKHASIKKKIDTQITAHIWKSMIKAYINYEFRKFKKK